MKPAMKPLKDSAAELAVERYLLGEGWEAERARKQLVHRPGLPPFSVAHDLFGCLDFIAFHPERGCWLIQVTCQPTDAAGMPSGNASGINLRKRKIEAVRWPLQLIGGEVLRISLLETRVRLEPGSRVRRQDFVRVHDMTSERDWRVTGELVLPRLKAAPKKRPQPAIPQAEMFDPNDPDMPPT